MFVSGSSDQKILLFDIKSEKPVSEPGKDMTGNNDTLGVECVKYSRHDVNKIATSRKNGLVQIWDVRNDKKPETSFYADSKSVMTLDWHHI